MKVKRPMCARLRRPTMASSIQRPAPVVAGGGAARLGDLVGRESARGAGGRQGAAPATIRPGHDNEDAAVEAEPERDHEERGEERPEGEADVAAHGEERHAARAPPPAHVAGELRPLRVVGSDARGRRRARRV